MAEYKTVICPHCHEEKRILLVRMSEIDKRSFDKIETDINKIVYGAPTGFAIFMMIAISIGYKIALPAGFEASLVSSIAFIFSVLMGGFLSCRLAKIVWLEKIGKLKTKERLLLSKYGVQEDQEYELVPDCVNT